MIDTHCHVFDYEAYCDDWQQVIDRARQAGVRHLVLPNINLKTTRDMVSVWERYPDFCSMAYGLHPEDVRHDWLYEYRCIAEDFVESDGVVAIGEIGIDLFRPIDRRWREQQMLLLEMELNDCLERDLPFIMHCRNGLDEILEVLDGLPAKPRGVFHCFAGTPADVERVRCRGDFFFGVNGVATYADSGADRLLPAIGLDRMLLETDSPYLTPEPRRGQRNEPAFITLVNEFVAQTLGLEPQEVSQTTDRNAIELFKIDMN